MTLAIAPQKAPVMVAMWLFPCATPTTSLKTSAKNEPICVVGIVDDTCDVCYLDTNNDVQ